MRRFVGFAHRGAPRHQAEANTLPAFARALGLGAGGIETDVSVTQDGVPVLIHRGLSPRALRISRLPRAALPHHIPSLGDLYEHCGIDFELALDMTSPQAAEAVVDIASHRGAAARLWLTYWRLPLLRDWRLRWPQMHLIYPTIPLQPGGLARTADALTEIGVDAVNIHHRFCTRRAVELCHRHNLTVFAWGIKRPGSLARSLESGVDGVFCDDVPAMVTEIRGVRSAE